MSFLTIDQDHQRFKQIVQGKVRENLKRFITQGEIVGRQGRDLVKIPLPTIDLPRFRYGENQTGGIGAGAGEPGDPVEGDAGEPGEAGNQPGEHPLEVELSLNELADLLGEELELPRIQPKGQRVMTSASSRYSSIRKVGPQSLRHMRRTYKEAMKRQITEGLYEPARPLIIPTRADTRYKARAATRVPVAAAVIFYLMDVSGSMGEEQKEIVRRTAFWIDLWLRRNYQNLTVRYIIHDATASEVDQARFYRAKEAGGTMISSAYQLLNSILKHDYPESDWNVYAFQFSDGDNWSEEDNQTCIRMLRGEFLPRLNLFAYGQVKSAYGSGQFLSRLKDGMDHEENLALAALGGPDDILDAIKTFLGKGN